MLLPIAHKPGPGNEIASQCLAWLVELESKTLLVLTKFHSLLIV